MKNRQLSLILPLVSPLLGLVAACQDTQSTPAATPTIVAAVAEGSPTPGTPAPPWAAPGMATIDALAAKLVAGGISCDERKPAVYTEQPAGKDVPPAPAIITNCIFGEEDITFYVFESAAKGAAFIAAKRDLLCPRAVKAGVPEYPGVAYVAADTWIVEPDELATAEKIAPLLGGETKMAGCPPVVFTPTP